MNKDADIAIVIPAYKSTFFRQTLESVLSQNEDNYNIYIGNDAGDRAIEEIIHSYGKRENLTYRYFNNNLGKECLPAHWNRCLEMVNGEKWIWLFSDDDLMDRDCIRNFRKAEQENKGKKLFRFNTYKFRNNEVLKENIYSSVTSLSDFLKTKFQYKSESYAVEYVFHQSLLKENGGFTRLPLGWCADDLFWIKCLLLTDMVTIADSFVHWRYSDENISGRENNSDSAHKKIKACGLFAIELKKLGLFETDKEFEYLFFRWILTQYLYLRSNLEPVQQEFFLSEISDLLPDAVLTYKQKNNK